MSPAEVCPWKPATMTIDPPSRCVWICFGVMLKIFALVWTPSVTIPACAPVKDTALAPSPCRAMAKSAMVVCSPVESSTSISRSLGVGHTSRESLIKESVTPDIAETTTTTLLPAC